MKNTRKIMAVVMIAMLVLAMIPAIAVADDADLSDNVVILYTGDVHGAVDQNLGYAGLVAYANEKKISNKYVTAVDTGDALSGSVLANVSKGEYAVKAMNTVGYTLSVPGVHEFDYGVGTFCNTLAPTATHEYISCNFKSTSTDKTLFSGYKIISYGATKVAFIGISDPQTIFKSNANFKSSNGTYAYSFCEGGSGKELYNAVQDTINEVKTAGADYIIALGHLSTQSDASFTPRSVIQNTSGINAFINGNSHTAVIGEQIRDKNGNFVLYTCAGSNLQNIGVMTIATGKSISTQLISSYAYRDIKTSQALTDLKNQYNANLKETFATTSVKLEAINSSGVRIVESGETNLGDLCADAYRVLTGADVAFVEAGEIKSNISLGDISYNDIMNVFPANDQVSVIQVSGYDLLDALEMSTRLYPNRNSGFLQISGLTFDIQETVLPSVAIDGMGNFVEVSDDYRVTNVMINGKELDLMDTYTVAGSNSLLDGKTGYSMFKNGALTKCNVAADRTALMSYIADNLSGTIGSAYIRSQGRIDSIKVARQSEIDAQVNKLVLEKMDDYSQEMEELRKQIEVQNQIIDIKSISLSLSSSSGKKNGKRYVKLTLKPSKTISGIKYQIYKSAKKTTGYSKIYTTSKTTFTNSSGLSKGKTYYYKVRGYKYLNGKYYYTDWSNTAYRTMK